LTFWYIRYRSGKERRIHLTDLLEGNRAAVFDYFRQHGIQTLNADEGCQELAPSRRADEKQYD
jgi:hypothetical protein